MILRNGRAEAQRYTQKLGRALTDSEAAALVEGAGLQFARDPDAGRISPQHSKTR
jgi:hypothetical protein